MTLKSPARREKLPPLVTLDTISPREITFLWYPYVPTSAATMIFGTGGVGKSHIVCDLAARISTGSPFPGQNRKAKPQKVLIMSAEDEADAVLVPRLLRAGADLTRIAIPEKPFTLDVEGLRHMEGHIRQFAATIVFIDPIVHFMGGKIDINRANEVRAMVGELHQIAIRTRTSIIIVHHSRKGNDGPDWERSIGSVDFHNGTRSVMFVTKSPSGQSIARHVKHNYSAPGETLGFQFTDGHFEWTDVYDDEDIAVSAPLHSRKRETARAFLRTVLSSGPLLANEVLALAEDEGLSPSTLNRAKIGVAESFYQKAEGVWYWRLLPKAGKRDKDGDEAGVSGVDHREPDEAKANRAARPAGRRVVSGSGGSVGLSMAGMAARGSG